MSARVGFESMEIGILDSEGAVGKIHEINAAEGGTISASVSGIGAQTNTTYASNVPFFVSAQGVGTVEVEVEIADLPYEALQDITGMEIDDDGILTVGSETRPPYVAVIMKSHSKDGIPQYFGLLKAKGVYDGFDLQTQEDGGVELNTDTLTFTGVARADSKVFAYGTKPDIYEKFKAFVFPTATGGSGTPDDESNTSPVELDTDE